MTNEGLRQDNGFLPSLDNETYSRVILIDISQCLVIVVIAAGLELKGIGDDSPIGIATSE